MGEELWSMVYAVKVEEFLNSLSEIKSTCKIDVLQDIITVKAAIFMGETTL